jgi:hypothetical protein
MPRYQFREDATIWRQMHFEDWDRLDTAARHDGLAQLFARYGHLVADVALWQRMSALEWDQVPQPLRAMAIVGMLEYWVQYYDVGHAHGLDPALVLRTAKAIAMSESWFDHRAVYVNADGSTDVGVGGASVFARDALRRLHARGLADFALDDHEYYNPWSASRWLAFWLQLSLDEADGDLSLAIRAYNVGIGGAAQGQGLEYLEAVERRRHLERAEPVSARPDVAPAPRRSRPAPRQGAGGALCRGRLLAARLARAKPGGARGSAAGSAPTVVDVEALNAPRGRRRFNLRIDRKAAQYRSGSSSAESAWRNHR